MKNFSYFLIVLIVLFTLTPQLFSQWSTDPALNTPVCTVSNSWQTAPVIMNSGSSAYLVAWVDKRGSESGFKVYAQRLSSNGTPVWSTDGIAVSGWGEDKIEDLQMISDGAGGAILVWTAVSIYSGSSTVSGKTIRAQRIDVSGDTLWGPCMTLCAGGAWRYNPAMISDGAGGAIVTWTDECNIVSTGRDIYAQRINASGAALWPSIYGPVGIAITTETLDQEFPTIASDGAGGAFIAWQDETGPREEHREIHGQHINSAGAAQWTANGRLIAFGETYGGNMYAARVPHITSDGSGGAIVEWKSVGAYAQRINASGARLWSSSAVGVQICAGGGIAPLTVKMLADGYGGTYLAWSEERRDGKKISPSDAFVQYLNASGIAQWHTDGVYLGQGETPSLTGDGSGGLLVTVSALSGSSYDIFEKRVSSTGSLLWNATVCSAAGYQILPAMVGGGSGGAVIVWQDERIGYGFSKVFGQWVSRSGFLGTQFTDMTTIPLPGVYGGSSAWGDYDNDGDLDLLLTGAWGTSGGKISRIYRNNGDNTFTYQSGISLEGVEESSVAWGDYDNDGDLDILLAGRSATGVVSKLYKNNGDNTFTEQTSVSLTGVENCSLAWGDYDHDGDMDILLTGLTAGGTPCSKIYKNNGNGTFTEQTGIALTGVQYSSVAWCDFNNDAYPDIILTGQDGSGSRVSKIYRNNADGTFTEQTGISLTGVASGSVACGDYDGDGYPDIVLTGLPNGSYNGVSKIYRNNGDGTFTEQTDISLMGLCFSSAAWGDCDNDGDLDLLMSGVLIRDVLYVSVVYRNNGGNQFVAMDNPVLTGLAWSSAAWGDFNNDGSLDILITGTSSIFPALPAGVSKIYRNNGNRNEVPTTPQNVTTTVDGRNATIHWDQSTDSKTPTNSLSYNLRIGTSGIGTNVKSPMSDLSTGYRRIVSTGNTSYSHEWLLKEMVPGSRYYYSVQSVDNTFAGSLFSPTGSIVVYQLSLLANHGTVTKDPDQSYFAGGTLVQLSAEPETGYHFVKWDGDAGAKFTPINIMMNKNKFVAAVFERNTYRITISAENGYVLRNPQISEYSHGSTVRLTANPSPGYHFTAWSGDTTGSNNPIDVTMYSNKNFTAGFAPDTYTLSVTATDGTVQRDPEQATYEHGSNVKLTANPAKGYHFSGWSGNASGTTNPLTVTMTKNTNITALFQANTYTLTINSASGTVSKVPNKPAYSYGDTVRLTVSPYIGYRFTHWSDSATGSANPIDVVMDTDKTVTANFEPSAYILSVAVVHGSVMIYPDEPAYDQGDTVHLTAVTDIGYNFRNWSGDVPADHASDNPLTIIMNQSRSITMNCDLTMYTITTDVSPSGVGKVSKNPDYATYAMATTVQLSAKAQSWYHAFSYWSGSVPSGHANDNPLSVQMDSNLSLTAHFQEIPSYLVQITSLQDTDGNVFTTGDQSPGSFSIRWYKTVVNEDSLRFQGRSCSLTPGKYIIYVSELEEPGYWTRVNGNRTPYDTIYVTTAAIQDTFIGQKITILQVNIFEDKDPLNPWSDWSDVVPKDWYLEIYKGSITGPVVASGNTDTLRFVKFEPDSFYIVEADTAGWKTMDVSWNIWRGSGSAEDHRITDPVHSLGVYLTHGDACVINWRNYVYKYPVSIVKLQDIDGDMRTFDRLPKPWYLSVYKDSIGSETLIAQNDTNFLSLQLENGPYIAVEADSGRFWKRINGSGTRSDTFTVNNGAVADTFVNFHRGALTVRKFYDADGDTSTHGDRSLKRWHIAIHKGGADGPVIYQGSDSVLTIEELLPDVYGIIEADSTGWQNIEIDKDGELAGAGETFVGLSVNPGEFHVVDWYNSRVRYGVDLTAENGATSKSPDLPSYPYGSGIQLTASPEDHYTFTNWTGNVPPGHETDNPLSVLMNEDKNVIAHFTLRTDTLTILDTNGVVTKYPDQTSYKYGSRVQLTAVPSPGYHFDHWSGDTTGTMNPLTVMIDTNKTIIAHFALNTYNVSVDAENGTVNKSPDQSRYDHGTSVQLTAVPVFGYIFTGWSGDTSDTVNPLTIIADGDKYIVANFEADSAYLTRYRSATSEEWATAHDQKDKLNPIARRSDKVRVAFVLTAPKTAGSVTMKFGMVFNGAIWGEREKNVFLDSISGAKEKLYSAHFNAGDSVYVEGWGSLGRKVTVRVQWKTLPRATNGTVAVYLENNPGLPKPNLQNVGEELFPSRKFSGSYFSSTNPLIIGVPRGAKGANSVKLLKYTDVQKSFIKVTKGVQTLHTGDPGPLDFFIARHKPIDRQQTSLPPDKHNNRFFAELLALKLNVAASTTGKFTAGLGQLTYDDRSDTAGLLNGMLVDSIITKADSVISGLSVLVRGDTLKPATVYGVIRKIDSSFADTQNDKDTISFAAETRLRGARKNLDVPFFSETPGIEPTITKSQNYRFMGLPLVYTLYQNYPNPFNPTTMIEFDLPEQAFVTLKVYNILGQEVRTLLNNEKMDDGTQAVEFGAGPYASGVYFCRLSAHGIRDEEDGTVGGDYVSVKKMVLIK